MQHEKICPNLGARERKLKLKIGTPSIAKMSHLN